VDHYPPEEVFQSAAALASDEIPLDALEAFLAASIPTNEFHFSAWAKLVCLFDYYAAQT
jgi:hypothetical protein